MLQELLCTKHNHNIKYIMPETSLILSYILKNRENSCRLRQGFNPDLQKQDICASQFQLDNKQDEQPSNPVSFQEQLNVCVIYINTGSTIRNTHISCSFHSNSIPKCRPGCMTHPDDEMENIEQGSCYTFARFCVCLLQRNKAFVGEADILSRLPSDSGAGGQLVPPQTLACQKRRGANECEHTAASYWRWHKIESFL